MLDQVTDRLAPIPEWAARALRRAEELDPGREWLPGWEAWGAGVKHGAPAAGQEGRQSLLIFSRASWLFPCDSPSS